jgi:hypothetical protein
MFSNEITTSIKEFCDEMNQCVTCFIANDCSSNSHLEDGLCPSCDSDLISDIKTVKGLNTEEIEARINEALDHEKTHWFDILIKELIRRKTDSCEGCKNGHLNQLGHIGIGGCLSES